VGKPCRIVVVHRQGNQGGVFANVDSVLPPRRVRTPVVVDQDQDQDELANA
jgi:hypothetical protein